MRKNFSYVLTSSLAMLLILTFVACQKTPTGSIQPPESLGTTKLAVKQHPFEIDPDNFVKKIDNPFLPLKPGTTFFYEGTKAGIPTTNEVFVTHDIKNILGVECTVVLDRAFEDGVLAESTFDWYAQDRQGNVWYFGEDTKELDSNGNVISTEGSWEAGVNSAKPGIIMEAHPKVGDRYRQEFAPGVAEDMAQVRSLDQSACVPYDCFDDLLMTKEWSLLDRSVIDHKYYAAGVGFILEIKVKGEQETSQLVQITTGN